jgi:hypothetical protein
VPNVVSIGAQPKGRPDRLRDLWAQVKDLYALIDKTDDKDQRFEIILKAMALESEANALELASLQSHPSQLDNDKK